MQHTCTTSTVFVNALLFKFNMFLERDSHLRTGFLLNKKKCHILVKYYMTKSMLTNNRHFGYIFQILLSQKQFLFIIALRE